MPKFKSDLMRSIHESATALHRIGAIGDTEMHAYAKATMRDADKIQIAPPPVLSAADIKRLREANHVSQPVFAIYLGTSASTVRQWETGAKKPSGLASRMLELIARHGLKILAA